MTKTEHIQILEDLSWLKHVEKHDKYITSILQAIQKNEPEMVKFLILQYVKTFNVEDLDSTGHSILHHLAFANNELALNEILKHGCDVNIRDKYGNTPLHYALAKNIENSCAMVISTLKINGAH